MPFFLRAILAPIVAFIAGSGVYFVLTDWSEEPLAQAVRTGNRLADMFYATPALEGHVWPVVYAFAHEYHHERRRKFMCAPGEDISERASCRLKNRRSPVHLV